jgi:IS30 family transposase
MDAGKDKVREMLDQLGLKNVEIATALGVHPNTVSTWCSTGRLPSSKFRKLTEWALNGIHPSQNEVIPLSREQQLDRYLLEELVAAIRRKGWKVEGLKQIDE